MGTKYAVPLKSFTDYHVTVRYKGHRYRLLWAGKTKYGHKVKLSFLNGTKEFWADIEAIFDPMEETAPKPRRHYGSTQKYDQDGTPAPSRIQCPECDSWHDYGEDCHDCGGI